jgi:1-acyl-sn-glycerol-3-phosphate acyltransferase
VKPIGLLCRAALRLIGWCIIDAPAPPPKAVFMVYPHTSNWDFPIGLLYRFGSGLPIHWAAKDSLFFWPLGGLFRRIGGVPVNRRERTGFVEQMAREFAAHSSFYLAIAPEGTRSSTGHLKSGFYRLALAADVPLALASIDYAKREVGVVDFMKPSGDEADDLARMATLYAGRRGKHPTQQAPFIFGGMDQSWRERGGA